MTPSEALERQLAAYNSLSREWPKFGSHWGIPDLPTFLVGKPIGNMLSAAVDSFPTLEFKLREEDLPEKAGCVWFDEPWQLGEHEGQIAGGFLWKTAHSPNSVDLALFRGSPADPIALFVWLFGATMDLEGEILAEAASDLESLLDAGDVGQLEAAANGWDAYRDTKPAWVAEGCGWATSAKMAAVAGSFWLFIKEPIVTISHERPERAVRRRLPEERHDTLIRVVQLRAKHSIPSGDGSADGREWNSQWIVRGHWHRYWVGPGKERLEPRWVHPYLKGDDGKPLKLARKDIFAVVR